MNIEYTNLAQTFYKIELAARKVYYRDFTLNQNNINYYLQVFDRNGSAAL